ncbi:MAG: adventurous gliding motility protein [Pseudobdellovibrio sp.]|jgi:anion-transporting  ArsA/GET3 family ATPase|nr:adventurous gliding motility protein [Pseudobdellovibrio sp.]
MIELRSETKTVICIGSGGVGKTTMSASLAAGWARDGKKVLVLTIDPSMRLTQTLGVTPDGDVHQVKLPEGSKGSLYSCVINHQKTFDWFIRTAAQNADVEPLLNNRLYQQLSGKLSGSQEFTSLISLHRYVHSREYDLVVLDTPPSQHTWNFLKAPEKISMLFNEGVTSWFRQSDEAPSFFKKIINLSTTQVLKALEMLTGSQFMKELSSFFRSVQKWEGPLEAYVSNCHRLLVSPTTEFLLVTALDSSRLNEAQKLSREILKQGYQLTSVIINRVPVWAQNDAAVSNLSPRVQDLKKYYKSLADNLSIGLTQFKKGLRIYKCFEQRQKAEDMAGLLITYDHIVTIMYTN